MNYKVGDVWEDCESGRPDARYITGIAHNEVTYFYPFWKWYQEEHGTTIFDLPIAHFKEIHLELYTDIFRELEAPE